MAIRSLRSAVRVVVTFSLCLGLASLFTIQIRYSMAVAGLLPIPQANAYEQEDHAQPTSSGNLTVAASYCSEVVAINDPANPSGRTSTNLTFDDAWLMADSRTYNHDLATTCAVLSAICNSESHFYGNVEGAIPYAEKTLSALDFKNIRTESYAHRSDPLDQIGAFFAGSHDVAAYAFASKTIAGRNRAHDTTIIFVGIRGSYGIEWLSNFKFVGDSDNKEDHWGYEVAETEIMESLKQYVKEIGADRAHTKVLITGHSRGGAIANLLAADLDDRSGAADAVVAASNVFAYTFASPSSTQSDDRDSVLYRNIFNIVNPSDIVPSLPLLSWGFGCYGQTVALPSVAENSFSSAYRAMQGSYRSNTGFSNPCDADDLKQLASFDGGIAQACPSLDSLMNPTGAVHAAQIVLKLDPGMALATHCPDTYIAWMQSTNSAQLSFM